MIRRLAVAIVITAAVWLTPGLASGHPLGNFTINLYSGVSVVPGQIRVDYVVDMAEDPTYEAKFDIDRNGDKVYTAQEFSAWAARLAPELASKLSIEANGVGVPLTVTCSSAYFRPGQTKETPTLRLEALFVGSAPASGRVTVAEGNYSDRVGWREITATGASGVAVSASSVPATTVSHALLAYPQDLLSSPLRTTAATFSYRTAPGATTPPMPTTCRRTGGSGSRPSIADSAFAGLVDRSGLPLMALSFLLAVGFGAWHALLPGHGKTLMAAYMVGAKSRMRQAVAIGVAVALMHTGSVLALGLLVLSLERTFRPDLLYPWLGLLSGLVAIGLGTTLLITRLAAWAAVRRDPEHDHHPGQAHEQGDDREHGHGMGRHTHAAPDSPVLSRKGLVALAVAGGILPAPAALLVLLASIEAHRVLFGLALIGAFSAGLAGALIGVGIAAFHARERMARRLASVWGRVIPVMSAAAIVGVGLFLAVRGAAQVRL